MLLRKLYKQARYYCLFCVVYGFVITANGQNYEQIQWREAVAVLKNVRLDTATPVIAVIDEAVNWSVVPKRLFWENSREIPDNGLDDDGNGYVDDVRGWDFYHNDCDITNDGLGSWHGTPVYSMLTEMLYDELQLDFKFLGIEGGHSITEIKRSLEYVIALKRLFITSKGAAGANILVLNCSWGKEGLWAEDFPEWCVLYDTLQALGVLVVGAVPNAAVNVSEVGDMPTLCSAKNYLAVTNENENGYLETAAYSVLDVDIAAPGAGSVTLLNSGKRGVFDGTSAATPYVSAVCFAIYVYSQQFLTNESGSMPSSEWPLLVSNFVERGAFRKLSLQDKVKGGRSLNALGAVRCMLEHFMKSELLSGTRKEVELKSYYPNPVRKDLVFRLTSGEACQIRVVVYGMSGATIYSENENVRLGVNDLSIDFEELEAERGVYLLAIEVPGGKVLRAKIAYLGK